MNKTLKIILIICISLALVFISALIAFFTVTADARLSRDKLINYDNVITVYDGEGNEISSAAIANKRKTVSLENLSGETVNAFIASEDRNFYSHHGLNYKRMLKALYKNIVSSSFKEGASTISQQLIKNTHLSNDKTITRKLKEIRLTKQLERQYSKNQIIEMYLNTIYFGHNCYGLQSAAQFYFSKNAEDLTLEQSATLVGLLTSPNNYSPFKNPEKSITKRNLVLKNMLDCGFISDKQYKESVESPLSAVKNRSTDLYADYFSAVFDELEDKFADSVTALDGCKIYTNLDKNAQQFIENLDYGYDNSVIITSNSGEVIAYKSTIDGARRQPGSTVKPLLVYAPSIEEKKIQLFSKINDEKTDFNGYSPENNDRKYHGTVTVAESIAKSYNLPAVKTLNALSLKKAEAYANKMGITLAEQEKNLSLALGGMNYGLSLKDITDCYSVFPRGGTYSPSQFIKEIRDKDGKLIFKSNNRENKVFSEGTCSLINEALINTAKTGTAKKLKDLPYDVAAKTGTCGNEDGNTDAYAISYTSAHTIGVWLGSKNNARSQVTGGNDCCKISKSIFSYLYENRTPENIDVESGTKEIYIDKEEYDKNDRIILADVISPKLNKIKVKCPNFNVPAEISDRFTRPSIQKPEINIINSAINIVLCQTKYYDYTVYREQNGIKKQIYDGNWIEVIEDKPSDGSYVYSIIPYYVYDGKKYCGKEITLPRVIIKNSNDETENKIPDIAYKDWYNQ